MKIFIPLVLSVMLCSVSDAQSELNGLWRGMIQNNGQSVKEADVFYISITILDQKVTGRTRIELLDQQEMAFKSFEGELKNGVLSLKEDYVRNSSNSRKAPTCKLNYELHYEDTTGYLKGSFKSSDCRGVAGKIIAYQTQGAINEKKEISGTHLWKRRFAEDYSRGYPAPKILDEERKNFKFEPIYFDHDKSEIRPEHYDYLNELARILGGIHDLRVEVIGHTDAVGTDEYNIGLSKRRAKAIKDYFKSRGIEPEKLEIDFKGERQPVDSNATPDGKQRNRRVDFKFI